MNYFVECSHIFSMTPLVCYYGFWGIQAVNVQGDSLFNRKANALCSAGLTGERCRNPNAGQFPFVGAW
jgi:hypothetical protein